MTERGHAAAPKGVQKPQENKNPDSSLSAIEKPRVVQKVGEERPRPAPPGGEEPLHCEKNEGVNLERRKQREHATDAV